MKKTLLTFVSALSLVATGVVVPAGAAELRFGYHADIQNLDPLTRREIFTTDIVKSIMEPLVERNAELEIEGALAESWEQLSPTLYRFALRPGVTFTNGYAFSADDVVETFRLSSHPKSLLRPLIASIADIRKIDDLTVELETHEPYPLLLIELTNMPIFSARWLAEHNVIEPVDPASDQDSYTLRNILGTGPFKLVEYQPGTRTVLEPNPDWWNDANKAHNLTRVEFYPLGQPAARVAALLSGQVDLVFPAPLQDVERIAATPGLKVVESPELRTLHIGMDLASPELRESDVTSANPFSDIRVRQAVYQAIDIEAIVETVMDGHASAVSSVIPADIGGYDPSLDGRLFPYDPEAARRLLAEAGYPDGFETGFDCPNDRYVNDAAICVAIAGMLARVGIDAHINLLNGARLFPKLEGRDSDM